MINVYFKVFFDFFSSQIYVADDNESDMTNTHVFSLSDLSYHSFFLQISGLCVAERQRVNV